MGDSNLAIREDLIQLANIFIAQLDEEGRILFLNRYALKITGYREEEILGKDWFEIFIPPESRQQSRRLFKEDLKRNHSLSLSELVIISSDGHEINLSVTAAITRDEKLNYSGIVILGHDRTFELLYEEKLRTGKRWQNLIDNVKEGIGVVDLSTNKIILFNDVLCEMTGYSRDEISSMTIKDFHSSDDFDEMQNKVEECLAAGKMVWETKFRRKDGSAVFVELRTLITERIPDPLVLTVISDITERRRTEEALKESENLLRTMIETEPECVKLVATDGTILKMNQAGLNMLEADFPEQVIGKSVFLFVTPEYHNTFKTHMEGILRGNSGILEFEMVGIKGRRLWLETHAVGLRNEKNEIIALVAVTRDITERKQMQNALQESEKKYHGLYDSIKDGIVMTDMAGHIKECNQAYLDMLGFTQEEVKQLTYQQLTPLNWHEMEDAIVKNQIVARGYSDEYEKEYIKKEGTEFPIAIRVWLIKDNQGKPLGMWAIVRDITERKRAEEILKELNIELKESNKKLMQLALKDSHTGLYNHRYLNEIIESEFHRAKRFGLSLSVIMLDIDYFKSINDVYGHRFGDMVLKQLAHLFRKVVRGYDIVIRFGGEEFVFILPDTDQEGALNLARRILDKITVYNFGTSKQTVHLKSSLGVVTYPRDRVIHGMGLVNLADEILGKAKDRGGNNVYSTSDIGKKEGMAKVDVEEADNVKFLKDKISKLTKRANQSLMEAIYAFARTIKLKDNYTGEHVEKTVHYAVEMSKALGLTNEEIENIRDAAMLHDLGKIGISEKILLKSSKLTPKEFKEIKKHPQIGADIVRPLHFLQSIIPLILYHHERYDGKGYLNGLKGEEIPIGARIIAIADVYQALISHRPYRKAYTKKEAIEIIKNGSGSQFDPHIIDVFLQILKKER